MASSPTSSHSSSDNEKNEDSSDSDFFEDLGNEPDLILENLWLGSEFAARNLKALKSRGIKFVLMCGEEFEEEDFYPNEFEYSKVSLIDDSSDKASVYFHSTSQWIHERINEGGVLVHCAMGMSRSATITIAYLMIKHDFSFHDALLHCQERRSIVDPNPGFRRQLMAFARTLEKERTEEKTKIESKKKRKSIDQETTTNTTSTTAAATTKTMSSKKKKQKTNE